MTDDQRTTLDRVIEIVESIRARRRMYFMPVDVPSAENFLGGFRVACFACGLEMPLQVRERVTIERGWPWYAARPIAEMRAKGLDEPAIVDELLAIEVAAWQRWRDGPV